MHPYERFRRNEVRDLDLAHVEKTLLEDGISYAIDVAPKGMGVWFDSVPKTNKPGNLLALVMGGKNRLNFTQNGWTTYAARTFTRTEDGKKRQAASPRSVLDLLQVTDVESANNVLADWHRTIADEQFRLIVRQATNELRLVATPEYELYLNAEFWRDVNAVSLDGFRVQKCLIDEDLFSVRIVQALPLDEHKNLFFGIELVNSENGSASLRGRFLLYDLVCTNGMYVNLGELILFRRIHRNWDSEKVREGVRDALRQVVENQGGALKLVNTLHSVSIDMAQAMNAMAIYKAKYDATDRFVTNVLENWETSQSATLWGLISAITLKAQDYSLSARLEHEKSAGLFATELLKKHGGETFDAAT